MQRGGVSLFALLLVLLAACAQEPPPAPPSEPEATVALDDAAAVDAVRAAYVEHYNMGHAAEVGGLFTEDAVTLYADGGVNMGRPAIEAALAREMTLQPTATIDNADTMVIGDHAFMRGSYRVEMLPPGAEPMGFGGHFLAALQRVDATWKIAGLLSNLDAPPPVGLPAGTASGETPPDLTDHAMAALTAAYAEHFNQGHADVVAGLYDEDAVVSFAEQPVAMGRAAVQAALETSMAMGSPQLTIHTVGVEDLGDGWYWGGGWHEMTMTGEGAPPRATGKWYVIAHTNEAGSLEIVWHIGSTDPPAM